MWALLLILVGSPAFAGTSDIDVPTALTCFDALGQAIHANEPPGSWDSAYPKGWAIVPGTIGNQSGAMLFRRNRPFEASFYSADGLTPNPFGGFMEFWGDAPATEKAYSQGKKIFNGTTRGFLADFLIARIEKIHSHFLKPIAPPPPLSVPVEIDSPEPKQAIELLNTLNAAQGVQPQGEAKPFDPKPVWAKILAAGRKKLSPKDRALFDKVQAWEKKYADWGKASTEWGRLGHVGTPPEYPSGEPTSEEREAYAPVLDQAEAKGLSALSKKELEDWKTFKNPVALGEIQHSTNPFNPDEAHREALIKNNEEMLAAVDKSFEGFEKLEIKEQMVITRDSLVAGLTACSKVKGDARVKGLATQLLGEVRLPPPPVSAPPAGSAGQAGSTK